MKYLHFCLSKDVEIKFDRLDIDARRYETTQFYRPYDRDFGFLHIVNIQLYDAGRYTCEAQTPLSRSRATAYILVAGPPGPCAGQLARQIVQLGFCQCNSRARKCILK